MKTLPLAFLMLLGGAAAVLAAPTAPVAGGAANTQTFASSGTARPALVELYTSEGCSSCPPAEAWLSQLVNDPQLWRTVVPVAFHVDYWDRLGWRDRFASPAATARQSAYATAWGGDTVYTPGLVLNGREWRQWSAFAPDQPPANPAPAGQLRAVVTDGRTVTVTYQPAEKDNAPTEAAVALLGCGLESNVKAGENQGRSLHHDFVALACETKPLSTDTGARGRDVRVARRAAGGQTPRVGGLGAGPRPRRGPAGHGRLARHRQAAGLTRSLECRATVAVVGRALSRQRGPSPYKQTDPTPPRFSRFSPTLG